MAFNACLSRRLLPYTLDIFGIGDFPACPLAIQQPMDNWTIIHCHDEAFVIASQRHRLAGHLWDWQVLGSQRSSKTSFWSSNRNKNKNRTEKKQKQQQERWHCRQASIVGCHCCVNPDVFNSWSMTLPFASTAARKGCGWPACVTTEIWPIGTGGSSNVLHGMEPPVAVTGQEAIAPELVWRRRSPDGFDLLRFGYQLKN